MPFQIHALPPARFSKLFTLDDATLEAQNMRRVRVEARPGTPCRVSLEDAEVGETVLLLNYEHQPAASPYRARHAIFVREGVAQARPAPGEVPEALRARLISVRLFDRDDMMIGADVVDGVRLDETLNAAFGDGAVAYVHLHNAGPGCFAASATRVR